jgi:hypothetical protein
MTIRAAEATQSEIDEVRSHLSSLAGRPQYTTRALGMGGPPSVALSAPHDVYTLGLDQLAGGAALGDARPVGRRFLVMDADDAIASAEVAPGGGGFQSNEGPFVVATAAAIRDAESDPELADGLYELRLLRIPAIYLVALWLKDDHGDADVLIPLSPAPAALETGRRYRPAELLPELRGLASEQLEGH